MDPFIDTAAATWTSRVEAQLREVRALPHRSLEENQVDQLTVESLLRQEIINTLKDYAQMLPSTLIGVVSAQPSLLRVAAEDLDEAYPFFAQLNDPSNTREAGGIEVWVNNHHPVQRNFGQRSETFVPSVGERWADIASDPEKAAVVAQAMDIKGYREGGPISPPELIRTVAMGRLRYAGLDAFKHDFSPVIAEVNARITEDWELATRRAQALEGLTPEWQSFLENSGQPSLSELTDAAEPAEAVLAEPGPEL
jgi:hypothetical protein